MYSFSEKLNIDARFNIALKGGVRMITMCRYRASELRDQLTKAIEKDGDKLVIIASYDEEHPDAIYVPMFIGTAKGSFSHVVSTENQSSKSPSENSAFVIGTIDSKFTETIQDGINDPGVELIL